MISLKKQAADIQEKLDNIEESNERRLRDQKIQENIWYDQNASQINDINTGNFFDVRV